MPEAMNLRDLSRSFSTPGRLAAIVLRPARHAPAILASEARAEPGRGLLGDRRASDLRTSDQARKREMSLFQGEHLPIVARWCGLEVLDPARLRRNLVIMGLNLVAMRSPFPDLRLEWAIGEEARIEVTGSCDPCSRMESELGLGGYNALRGHGGMTARILEGGVLRVGDSVRLARVQVLPQAGT
jgi:MOSC domain-containing protein YiiM